MANEVEFKKTILINNHIWTVIFTNADMNKLYEKYSDVDTNEKEMISQGSSFDGLALYMNRIIYIKLSKYTDKNSTIYSNDYLLTTVIHEFFHAWLYEMDRQEYGQKYSCDETLVDLLAFNFNALTNSVKEITDLFK